MARGHHHLRRLHGLLHGRHASERLRRALLVAPQGLDRRCAAHHPNPNPNPSPNPNPNPNPKVSIVAAQLITVAVNLPAIALATLQLSVLSLFIMSNLLTVAVCMPIAMGMWNGTNPKVALVGAAAGIVVVFLVFITAGAMQGDVAAGLGEIYYSFDLRSPVLLSAFILSPTVRPAFFLSLLL
jgi:hypothetical protein